MEISPVSRFSSVRVADHAHVLGHRLEDRVDHVAQVEAAVEDLADLEEHGGVGGAHAPTAFPAAGSLHRPSPVARYPFPRRGASGRAVDSASFDAL